MYLYNCFSQSKFFLLTEGSFAGVSITLVFVWDLRLHNTCMHILMEAIWKEKEAQTAVPVRKQKLLHLAPSSDNDKQCHVHNSIIYTAWRERGGERERERETETVLGIVVVSRS